jgi:hypothetical protein
MRAILLLALAGCAREPGRPAPASPTPAAARSSSRASSIPSPTSPAPAELSFSFLPDDLRTRAKSLVDIQCPSGTKRVETNGYGQTHRHCETPNGTYEGPIVDFGAELIHLRGTHDGLRAGVEVSANEGGAIESEFAAGHPVGHYRYRRGTVTVAEGNFDADGRLDGEWIFRMPVSGQELMRTKMVHGTGSIEIWDWRHSQPQVTSRMQCKDGLLEGTQMFHTLSSYQVYGHRVDGEYRRGLPDGTWKLTRIKDGVVLMDGTYRAGSPTGTWRMIAQHPCLAMMHGGDTVDCVYGTDLPYTCVNGKCKFDSRPKVPHTGMDVERVEHDDTPPPRAEMHVRKCELGAPYF